MLDVGIIGATGYTGVELVRLLGTHAQVRVRVVTSREQTGKCFSDLFPNLLGHCALNFAEPDHPSLNDCHVVFFATPHGVAMQQAAALLKRGCRVIDLSADFRLKNVQTFEEWYTLQHSCPDLLQEAVYGLPEINRKLIQSARLVAAPGCYPTAVQLGLAPLLLPHCTIDHTNIIANCASGVSGAGRKAELGLLHAEISENYQAYALGGHRHQPEIEQQLSIIAGQPIRCQFTPHLLPMNRGILATLYAQLLPQHNHLDLQRHFTKFYQQEKWIHVLPQGKSPQTRSVRFSNNVHISVQPTSSTWVVVLVAIDNLVKGAAGQAIQCMNLMFGIDEHEGLLASGLLP